MPELQEYKLCIVQKMLYASSFMFHSQDFRLSNKYNHY